MSSLEIWCLFVSKGAKTQLLVFILKRGVSLLHLNSSKDNSGTIFFIIDIIINMNKNSIINNYFILYIDI